MEAILLESSRSNPFLEQNSTVQREQYFLFKVTLRHWWDLQCSAEAAI